MASVMKRISLGLSSFLSLLHLVHQLFVDVQAAGGVHDQRIAARVARLSASLSSEPSHQRRAGYLAFWVAFIELGFNGLGDDLKLLAGRRAIDVHRDQHRAMAAFFEPCGQLARCGRLAGALQSGHQDHRGRLRGESEAGRVLAQQRDQLVADDLDDLLGGRERGQHFGADGLDADLLDQVADHVEVDVGFEQRHANLAQGVADVLFGERALAAKALEGAL